MLQPIFDFIEKFSTDFSWRRLGTVISVFLLFGLLYFIYESQTNSIQLGKYERATDVLINLQGIETPSVEEQLVINQIISGLESITYDYASKSGSTLSIKKEIRQAFFGGIIWLILTIAYLPSVFNKNKDGNASAVAGCIILAVATGTIGYFLPITWSDWIIFGLYPIGFNITLLLFFAYYGNK